MHQQLMYQPSAQQASYDFLHLQTQPKFQPLLQPKEQLLLSTTIFKYNSQGKCQERILVITNHSILNILKSENIIKTFMKKFINFQNKYQIKRRILIANLYGITVTADRTSNVFLLHVNNEHDYHYRAQNNKMVLLRVIAEEYKKITKNNLPFYFKEEGEISHFCTMKCHIKEKKDIKPKDNPVFLNDDYFLDKKFGNEAYVCQYSHKNQSVQPQNFKRVQLKQLKNGKTYFILKEEFNRSINVQSLHRSSLLLNPYYSFYSQKKQLLFIPFMIGGNLKKFLFKSIPLKQADLIFYLCQIVIFLDQFHKCGKIYCNVTLQNIFLKENGYIIFDGLEKSIQEQPQDKLLFKIFGNPYYFPPEVIECRGYGKQIDVWKLGICAYILCKGQYPFEGSNIKELYYNIIHKSIQEENIPNFIKRMLEKKKEKRIKIEQLLTLDCFGQEYLKSIKEETEKAPYIPEIAIWKSFIPIIYQLQHKEEEKS